MPRTAGCDISNANNLADKISQVSTVDMKKRRSSYRAGGGEGANVKLRVRMEQENKWEKQHDRRSKLPRSMKLE
jgi:hypothetical protein